MKKLTVYLLTTLLLVNCKTAVIAQNCNSDTLIWNTNYKLQRKDFKGIPNTSKLFYNDKTAASSIEISASGYWENDMPNFEVKTTFIKMQSWYRDSIIYDNVLSHEQLHFDIAELFARKIKARVKHLRDSSFANIQMYSSEIEKLLKKRTIYDSLYDGKTYHGLNYSEQDFWRKKVNEELKRLKE